MIDISRTVRPLIRARQRCGGVMFVETFAGNDGMFQIGRKRLQSGRKLLPIVKCGLQTRDDVRGVGIPSKIVRHDNQMSVTTRLQ